MAKVLKVVKAELVDARPAPDVLEGVWDDRRLGFVGKVGYLRLCESERRCPEAQFLHFTEHLRLKFGWRLQTSFGEVERWDEVGSAAEGAEAARIVFVSRNTRYEFKVLESADGLWNK